MKNTQYSAYLWPNRRNSRASKNRSRGTRWWRQILDRKWKYISLSFMRHASGHNYRNISFIVDVAMGQIPRSTERISSYLLKCTGASIPPLRPWCVPPRWPDGSPNFWL